MPAGSFTVSLVELLVVIEVAALVPKVTDVTVVKFVPVIVTVVPPAAGPEFGVTLVTVGAGRYVKAEAFVPVPPAAVTATVTAGPADPAGSVTFRLVEDFEVIEVTALPPKVTEDTVVK